jgi:hypothetical protein
MKAEEILSFLILDRNREAPIHIERKTMDERKID